MLFSIRNSIGGKLHKIFPDSAFVGLARLVIRRRLSQIKIMIVAAVIVLLVMLVLGLVTTVAFSWAASNHQFENSEEGSLVIFDADECIGRPTDPQLRRETEP